MKWKFTRGDKSVIVAADRWWDARIEAQKYFKASDGLSWAFSDEPAAFSVTWVGNPPNQERVVA